ncbi:hypothetical protein DIS18_01040 [Algibacter marinivivus]|uniref:Uncharacterized protein n=1 Tax=Algibacter marinivivus TaxID=2100723 RepID=A0A2U2X5W7_9FLAO|nr:hypothetical protein [Algibacter marinivivus]PWH83171.1 hypothetical protein DIS18_01040 [Algibacter marinivivus]
MLNILLIYFIGKYFYQLAGKYKQNKWLYAILGVGSYYLGAIVIGGILVGLYVEFMTDSYIENYSKRTLGFILMPFGIGCAYLFHYLLEKRWRKTVDLVKDEIEDIGKTQEEN